MEEQPRSQRRQQILAGVGILGGLAGGLALKLLEKHAKSAGSNATPAPRRNAEPQGSDAPYP